MDRIWMGAAAVGAIGLAGLLFLWPAPSALPEISFTPPGTTAGLVTLHVSGEVVRPGLVSVPRDSRIADVILAAGGALPEADLTAMNLAAPIVDGQQLVVPGRGEGGQGQTVSQGAVRINAADASALEMLPGVGPVLAERIVAHRNQHGPFQVVQDLLDVPGIGEAKLAAIRDSVIVP